jgi:hypothetical protein
LVKLEPRLLAAGSLLLQQPNCVEYDEMHMSQQAFLRASKLLAGLNLLVGLSALVLTWQMLWLLSEGQVLGSVVGMVSVEYVGPLNGLMLIRAEVTPPLSTAKMMSAVWVGVKCEYGVRTM